MIPGKSWENVFPDNLTKKYQDYSQRKTGKAGDLTEELESFQFHLGDRICERISLKYVLNISSSRISFKASRSQSTGLTVEGS